MAVQVEVISDSERARKDLELLRNAITQIRVAASNFNFNPFSDKAAASTKAAAESLNKITESSKRANEAFKQFNSNTKDSLNNLNNATASYGKINKSAETLKSTQTEINKITTDTDKKFRVLETTVNSVSEKFKQLAKVAVGTVAAYATSSTYISYTDTITSLNSKLRLSAQSQGAFNAALKDTRDIAVNTRTGLSEVTDLYTKLILSTSTFSRSQEDVAKVTATVSRAVAISGSSMEASAAAVMQLGQAFSSGILQGDELRSISENASQLMQVIADGFGKTIGQVRQLGAEGKLTSESLFKAILSQASVAEGKFNKMGVTFGQALTNLKTSSIILFSEIDKAFSGNGGTGGQGGASGGLPEQINKIAKLISSFAEDIGWQILRLKIEAFLLFNDVKKFLDTPLEIKLKTIRLTVDEILPTQEAISQFLIKAFSSVKSTIASVVDVIAGNPQRRASGGYISGPGTGTSDSIPAMLSNGEFVVNARATSDNREALEAINSGKKIRKFATGGHVENTSTNAEEWLYRSVKPKKVESNTKESTVNIVIQPPAQTAPKEKLFFETIRDSLSQIFKGFLDKIKPYLEKIASATETGSNIVIKKLEQWIPGLSQAIAIFKSMSGIGPYTGGGPQRNSPNRMFGHDFLNTFVPVQMQIPVISVVTAAAGGLIALATGGTLRTVLLSLLTTAYGLFIGNTVYDSEIQRVNGVLLKSAFSIAKSVTDALFGSGIFGERGFGGTLALIAKLSLLFSAGREYVTKAALSTVTFPTTLANSTSTYLQSQYASMIAERRKKELETVEKVFERSKNARDAAIRDLTGMRLAGTRRISTAEATQIAQNTGPIPFGVLRSAATAGPNTVAELARLSGAARSASENLSRLEATQKGQLESLKKVVAATTEHADALKKNIKEQASAARTGIINTSAGIGGIFGALGGFNLGTQIAEGMTNASDWQKVGTIMATTMLGQGIAAGITSTLSAAILTLIPTVLGLLGAGLSAIFAGILATAGFVIASPILLTLATGAVALAAVLNWDKLVAVFKDGWAAAKPVFEAAWKTLSESLNKFLKSVEEWWDKRGREQVREASDSTLKTKVPGTQGDVGDAIGITGATVAGLSAFSLQYTQLPVVLASTIASIRNSLIAVQVQIGALGPQLAPIATTLVTGAAALLAAFTSPVWGTVGVAIVTLGAAVLAWKAWAATREWLTSKPENLNNNQPIKPFADPSQIPGRATGGIIYGPGSSTSDSIPAMLSNGEFVVNANATSRYRDLLERINNNKTIRYFSQGGFVEAYTPAAQRVGKMLGVDPEIVLRHWALESGNGRSLMTPFHNLANITAGSNYSGTSTISADTDAEGNKIKQRFRTYKSVDEFADDYVALIKKQYKNAENAGDSMLKFAQALKEGGWATSKTYVEDLMNTHFSANRSPWRGRTNQTPGSENINWEAMPLGIGEYLKKVDFGAFPGGRYVEKALVWMSDMLTSKSKKIETAIDPLGDNLSSAAEAVNKVLGESKYSANDFKDMGRQEFDILRNALNTFAVMGPPRNELEGTIQGKALKDAIKAIQDVMAGGVKSSSSITASFQGKSAVESVEILNNAVRSNIKDAFSMSEYEKLSSSDIKRILEIVDLSNELKSKMGGMSEFDRELTNKYLRELWEQVVQIKERVGYSAVSSSGAPYSANAQKAGTTFATSFQTELSAGLTAALSGKSTFKQFGKLILETLSASVLNNFSKGFVEKIFETTKLGDYLSKGISEIYTFGEKGGKSLGGGIASLYDKPPLTMADHRLITNPNIELSEKSTELLEKPFKLETEPLKEVLSTSWTSLGSILSGIGSGIVDVVTGIGSGIGKFFSLFAFADGGYVKGPGTSTSDSIPAMLSNGEFVINAKATQKYGALLQRINTDTMPHFASGGLVSELPRTINSEENKSNNTSGGNTSVFNINITGDISMQTRKQVMSMIPEIAAGTNAHNREINYSYGKR